MPVSVLWLDLNSSYAHSSLALPAIHAQMSEDKTAHWQSVSATVNENPTIVAAEVSMRSPEVVAATCWLFNREQLLHILARVKTLLPDCCIVLGGPEFLGSNKSFLRSNLFIDAVFRGEGEEVVPQWLDCWNKRERWKNIPGLCYLDSDSGDYIDNGIARVSDFQSLLPPENSRFFNWNKPFVQLETTRGCFNTCAFCVSGGEKPVRNLSIETIRERIAVIYRNGIRDVRVLDRTFNYNFAHAKQLLHLFADYPDMRFHLEIHPALLSENLKAELARMPMGVLHLEAGIQSLNQKVLTACARIGKLQDALEGLRYLCQLKNVETHADLIAGLPFYTLEQIFEDVRTLASLGTDEIQLESLKLLPGTDMRRKADEWGLKYAPLPPYEVLQTPDITPKELYTAGLLSRLIDGYYNSSAWKNVTRQLILDYPDFLHVFLDHLCNLGVADQPMSLEKRGIILYHFCQERYPKSEEAVSMAWIEAGMSLKKSPAARVRTKHITIPESWIPVYGEYQTNMKICMLPCNNDQGKRWWYGFESQTQQTKPVFKAYSVD